MKNHQTPPPQKSSNKYPTHSHPFAHNLNPTNIQHQISRESSPYQYSPNNNPTPKHLPTFPKYPGNKLDLEYKRVVKTDELLYLAEDVQLPVFEVSAKEGTNITEVFETMVDLVMTEISKSDEGGLQGSVLEDQNKNRKKKKKRKCC